MKFKGLIFIILLYPQSLFGNVLNDSCWAIENRISRVNPSPLFNTNVEKTIRKNEVKNNEEIEAIHLSKDRNKIASIYFLNLRGKKSNTSRITNVFLDTQLGHPSQLTGLVKEFLREMDSIEILEVQVPEEIYKRDLVDLRRNHLAFHIFTTSGLKFLKKDVRQEITGGESPTIQYFLQFKRG